MPHIHRRAAIAALILAAACGADAIVGLGNESTHVTIGVGQVLTVTLGNVGPGTYGDPPIITSDALAYVGVEVIPPFTPGGPTQRFTFRGAKRGQAVIEFRRTLGDTQLAFVKDTIDVR